MDFVPGGELSRRIREGDLSAESDLIRQFEPGLRVLLRRRTGGDLGLLQDLVQETLLVVLKRLRGHGIEEPEKLAAFAAQTARNLAIASLRKAERQKTDVDSAATERNADSARGVEALAEDVEAGLAVRTLLRELLQPRDRLMLRRFYLEDQDKEVICREMHLSEAAFNQALSRARRRFRQILEERGFTMRDLLDQGNMNRQLIEDYVAGKMSEAQAEAFEESCVANPELAKQVEFEQRLKNGIKIVAAGSTAEFVRSESPWRWMLPLAASVLIFVTAGSYLWEQMANARRHILASVSTPAQRNGTSMRLALVRGGDGMPHLPPGKVRVEIVGLFDPAFYYTVALDHIEEHTGIETIATLYGQHPSSPVTLEVMVGSDEIASGSYLLRVQKQTSKDEATGAEDALDFSFMKD